MNNKISVITVVFNDVSNIRETIESFFSQTWEDKEYIIIDGGSTDGTVEIIKEYADKLAYWCSEKDQGIYDAMNKAILHVTGDWINFLNSGDSFANKDSLLNAIRGCSNIEKTDVIYGNSIEITNGDEMTKEAGDDITQMEFCPIFRHGSSLIRTSIQKHFSFDISKKRELGFALDWNTIYNIFKAGKKFQKVDTFIQKYQKEGISNNIQQSLKYNYKITSQDRFSFKKKKFYYKESLKAVITNTAIYHWTIAFLFECIVNDILPHIPFWSIRKYILRKAKTKIGIRSFIMKKCYMISPGHINIGNYSTINRGCLLDARGNIHIGSNVSISHDVKIVTGGHDVQSSNFSAKYLPVKIDDYVWIGTGSIILQGVHIAKGAVVCAGAVVTHDIEAYSIVAGVPAKEINKRNNNLEYHCIWDSPFT